MTLIYRTRSSTIFSEPIDRSAATQSPPRGDSFSLPSTKICNIFLSPKNQHYFLWCPTTIKLNRIATLGSHNEGHLSLILLWPKTRGELPLSVAQRTPGEDEEAGELFVEVGAIHQRHPESILSEKKLVRITLRRNAHMLKCLDADLIYYSWIHTC